MDPLQEISSTEINTRYRNLALTVHPDKIPCDSKEDITKNLKGKIAKKPLITAYSISEYLTLKGNCETLERDIKQSYHDDLKEYFLKIEAAQKFLLSWVKENASNEDKTIYAAKVNLHLEDYIVLDQYFNQTQQEVSALNQRKLILSCLQDALQTQCEHRQRALYIDALKYLRMTLQYEISLLKNFADGLVFNWTVASIVQISRTEQSTRNYIQISNQAYDMLMKLQPIQLREEEVIFETHRKRFEKARRERLEAKARADKAEQKSLKLAAIIEELKKELADLKDPSKNKNSIETQQSTLISAGEQLTPNVSPVIEPQPVLSREHSAVREEKKHLDTDSKESMQNSHLEHTDSKSNMNSQSDSKSNSSVDSKASTASNSSDSNDDKLFLTLRKPVLKRSKSANVLDPNKNRLFSSPRRHSINYISANQSSKFIDSLKT